MYYRCFFGANAHLGLTEDDSFAMEDDKGRSWICHPIKREDVEALDLFKDFPAIKEADEKIGADTEVPEFAASRWRIYPVLKAHNYGLHRRSADRTSEDRSAHPEQAVFHETAVAVVLA